MKEKCIVMLSGGLDSRLVVKIMQEKGFVVTAVFFKLPFAKDNEKEIREFVEEQKVKLEFFDCTRGRLLQEYLEIIKDAKFGRGAGINPCIDCKIFMFRKVKEFADKEGIEFVATGEVEGQRPMSQMKKSLKLIEEKSGLGERLIRPLSEFGITGRRRDKQMALAKKFGIDFPHPAGGCILCEKELKNRFKFLLDRGMDDKEIKFVNIGRHFVIDGCWVVLGRDEDENKILESLGKNVIVPDFPGPSALILDECNEGVKRQIDKLIEAYSKKGSLEERENFDRWKI